MCVSTMPWIWFIIVLVVVASLTTLGVLLGLLLRAPTQAQAPVGIVGLTGDRGLMGAISDPQDGPRGPDGPPASLTTQTGATGAPGGGTGPTGPNTTTSSVPMITHNTTATVDANSGAVVVAGGVGTVGLTIGGVGYFQNPANSFGPFTGGTRSTLSGSVTANAIIDGIVNTTSTAPTAISVPSGGVGIGDSLHAANAVTASKSINGLTGLFVGGVEIPQFMARNSHTGIVRFTGGSGIAINWNVLYALGTTGASGASVIDYDPPNNAFILKARGRYLVSWDANSGSTSAYYTWAQTSESSVRYGYSQENDTQSSGAAIIPVNNPPQTLTIRLATSGFLGGYLGSTTDNRCVVQLVSLTT